MKTYTLHINLSGFVDKEISADNVVEAAHKARQIRNRFNKHLQQYAGLHYSVNHTVKGVKKK